MQYDRDDYLNYLSGKKVDKPIFVEIFGPLIGLDEEWRAQGASDDELALTAYGFDSVKRFRVPVNCGFINGQERQILEDTDEYQISIDGYGRRMKLCKATATIPLPMEYPVTDWEGWERYKKNYLYDDSRLADGWLEKAKAAREDGRVITVDIPGGFDELRQLMGEEELCISYYTQPDLIKDMLDTMTATCVKVLDQVSSQIEVDVLMTHEDMAGKSGSLIGPNLITEFIKPYYRASWDLLKSRGAKVFTQDSDGDMNVVMDAFIDAGVTNFYPMEPAANMDIVKSREKYGPSITYTGGIDKHVLRASKEDIRKELEYKLGPEMQKGGIIFGLDHRIPNGTPLENYRYYVKTARELLGLPAIGSDDFEPGWARMTI